MKELYYENDNEIKCEGKKVNVNNIQGIKITYPDNTTEYFLSEFVPYNKTVNDGLVATHESGFMFNLYYKGMWLEISSQELFKKGCKLEII